MTALELLKEELKSAREVFEGTVADLTETQLHKDPGGKALPIGAVYAHLLLSEDMTTHQFLQGKTPLFESSFKGKTGADTMMPPMDEHWSTAHESWAKTVKIDLKQLQSYAKAVYAATETYISGLKDADLIHEVDLGGWGKKTVAYMLHAFIIGHTNNLAGEISALKGTQGLKGYQF